MRAHHWPVDLVPAAPCAGCGLAYANWSDTDPGCPGKGDIYALLVEVDAKLDRLLAAPGNRSFVPHRHNPFDGRVMDEGAA